MVFLLTATVLPFAWQHLLIPVAVALAALTLHATCRIRTRTWNANSTRAGRVGDKD